jgi:hypothetical protein
MAKAYPKKLREEVIKALTFGDARNEVAKRFKVDPATVTAWAKVAGVPLAKRGRPAKPRTVPAHFAHTVLLVHLRLKKALQMESDSYYWRKYSREAMAMLREDLMERLAVTKGDRALWTILRQTRRKMKIQDTDPTLRDALREDRDALALYLRVFAGVYATPAGEAMRPLSWSGVAELMLSFHSTDDDTARKYFSGRKFARPAERMVRSVARTRSDSVVGRLQDLVAGSKSESCRTAAEALLPIVRGDWWADARRKSPTIPRPSAKVRLKLLLPETRKKLALKVVTSEAYWERD